MRLMLCGSAPMRGNVMTFMRATMGCVIVEGYGLTECVGPVTLNVPGDPHPDQVISCGKKVSKLPTNGFHMYVSLYTQSAVHQRVS